MISLEMVGYFDSSPGSQTLPSGVAALLPNAPGVGDFYALTGKAYARKWVQAVSHGLSAHLRTPLLTLVLPDLPHTLDYDRMADLANALARWLAS